MAGLPQQYANTTLVVGKFTRERSQDTYQVRRHDMNATL